MLDSSKTMTKLTCIVIPIDFYQRKPFILTHNYIVLLFHFVCLGLSLSIVWSFWLKIQSANLRFNRTFSLQSTKIAWIIPKELMIFMFFFVAITLFTSFLPLFYPIHEISYAIFSVFKDGKIHQNWISLFSRIAILLSTNIALCHCSSGYTIVLLCMCASDPGILFFYSKCEESEKTSTISHVSGSGQNANNL